MATRQLRLDRALLRRGQHKLAKLLDSANAN